MLLAARNDKKAIRHAGKAAWNNRDSKLNLALQGLRLKGGHSFSNIVARRDVGRNKHASLARCSRNSLNAQALKSV